MCTYKKPLKHCSRYIAIDSTLSHPLQRCYSSFLLCIFFFITALIVSYLPEYLGGGAESRVGELGSIIGTGEEEADTSALGWVNL